VLMTDRDVLAGHSTEARVPGFPSQRC
jgi:hypothetical protein